MDFCSIQLRFSTKHEDAQKETVLLLQSRGDKLSDGVRIVSGVRQQLDVDNGIIELRCKAETNYIFPRFSEMKLRRAESYSPVFANGRTLFLLATGVKREE